MLAASVNSFDFMVEPLSTNHRSRREHWLYSEPRQLLFFGQL
jgi:hypothetical protein